MAWDQTEAAKLRQEGLTQEQIGFALGRIAEHRMQADREGYSRGYENGKLDWKGVREKPKPTDERKKIIEGIAKFYLNRSQKASNTWNEAVIKTTVAIRNLGICNLHVRNDEGKTTEHTAGTMIVGRGAINLGLPKGFNRLSIRHTYNNIRLFEKYEDHPGYDHLNVPVWAMQKTENGMDILFVRCYLPRVDRQFVDVILNGKLEDVQRTFPNVIDVSTFIDEID